MLKNNKNAAGYSLLSLLVYCALLAFMGALIMPYVVATHRTIVEEQEQTRLLVQNMIAFDVLVDDIQAASSLYKDWKRITDLAIVMHTFEYDVGWIIKDQKLFRIEGEYDKDHGIWHTSRKSLIATNISALHIIYDTNKHDPRYINSVTIQLIDDQKKEIAVRTVVLPNRILV